MAKRKESAALSSIPDALKQKMAQSVAGTGHSMVPPALDGGQRAQPKEEVVYSIDDLIDDSEDITTLRQLINRHIILNDTKKTADKALEPITTRIKKIIGQYGIDKAVCDGATLTYVQGSRYTIDKLKLLANGVTEDIIVASTDVSITHTLTIRGAK